MAIPIPYRCQYTLPTRIYVCADSVYDVGTEEKFLSLIQISFDSVSFVLRYLP